MSIAFTSASAFHGDSLGFQRASSAIELDRTPPSLTVIGHAVVPFRREERCLHFHAPATHKATAGTHTRPRMRWLPMTSLRPRTASTARRLRLTSGSGGSHVGYQNNGPASTSHAGGARAAVRGLGSTTASGGQGPSMTLGFVGLGQMGARMAANLLSKSPHPLLVYDTNAKAIEALKAKGAQPAASLEELASQADVLVTMLPASQHVTAVLEGNVLPNAKKGTLIVDSSTIDPTASRRLIAAALQRGLEMVDAPVSGGVGGAEDGTLTFMCGGDQGSVARAEQAVLRHMGQKVVHCGGPGTGGIAKICNNLVLGVNMVGVAEAMNLGVRLGIDPQVLNSVLNASSGRSWVTELYNPVPGVVPTAPASKGYAGGFASALMQKDLGIAGDAARAVNAPLPMAALAQQVYALLASHGQGRRDFSAVYEFVKGGSCEDGKKK